jgi:hypothetical protein
MKEITEDAQRFVVYKINPNEQEINGEVNFDRNSDGRILYGNAYIVDHSQVVKNEDGIVQGVFSLNHYYFLP